MAQEVRRSRGEYSKTAQRRDAILDAATEVFSRSGFAQSTLSDIARAAGISVAGLNHHFATKRRLLEAVFERGQQTTEVNFFTDDPMEQLRAAVELSERGQRNPHHTRLFAVISAEATTPDHPAHEYFLRHYDSLLDIVRATFEALQRDGRLRPGVSPEDAARAYMSLADGLQLQALYQPEAFSQADVLRRVLSSLLTEDI